MKYKRPRKGGQNNSTHNARGTMTTLDFGLYCRVTITIIIMVLSQKTPHKSGQWDRMQDPYKSLLSFIFLQRH